MQNILLYVLIAITAANLFFLIRGKRRKALANARYRAAVDSLKIKATKEMEKIGSRKGLVYPYVNDDNLCFLLCSDEKHDLMSIVTEDNFFPMKISSKKTCDIVISAENEDKFNAVDCVVRAEDLDVIITLSFASKPHRRKSIIGKFILQNAEEFKNYIVNGFPEETESPGK